MNKAIVIGCPGSGKSHFARALHQKTGLPLCHLDLLYWNADRTTVEKPIFRARLSSVMDTDRWIIDGNYASTMELRLGACDTVFFLDYPTSACLDGVRERRGRPREDLPWVETEEDEEFIGFIQRFQSEQRPRILSLLQAYPEKTVYVFRDRTEADLYINSLACKLVDP
jgi:adenylate kinase family enzyme